MILKRLLLIALLVVGGFAISIQGFYQAPVASAHQDTKIPTGYPTGSICKKSGTYRAANKYLENIIVMAEGEVFPPFSDGTKTLWYHRGSTTKNQ
jgi:hypothetical protein